MAVVEDCDRNPDGETAAHLTGNCLRLRFRYATVPMISRYGFKIKPLRLESP